MRAGLEPDFIARANDRSTPLGEVLVGSGRGQFGATEVAVFSLDSRRTRQFAPDADIVWAFWLNWARSALALVSFAIRPLAGTSAMRTSGKLALSTTSLPRLRAITLSQAAICVSVLSLGLPSPTLADGFSGGFVGGIVGGIVGQALQQQQIQ